MINLTEADAGTNNARKIVVICSRAWLSEENEEGLMSALLAGVNWAELLYQGTVHRVLNMVWYHFMRLGHKRRVEKDLSNLFDLHYRAIGIRNARYYEELAAVSSKLEAKGVRAVLLKGGLLAATVYPALEMRHFNDLDFLIKLKDAAPIASALSELGYVQGDYDPLEDRIKVATRKQKMFHQMTTHEMQEFNKLGEHPLARLLEVDMNHSILWTGNCPYTIDNEALVDRAVRVSVCGSDTWALGPEDCLLQLCCHLYREATLAHWIEDNRDLKLYKFGDIASYVTRPGASIDWDRFLELVRANGLEKVAWYVLHYVQKLYDLDVLRGTVQTLAPADVSHLDEYTTRDGVTRKWKNGFEARLFSSDRAAEVSGSGPKSDYFTLRDSVG